MGRLEQSSDNIIAPTRPVRNPAPEPVVSKIQRMDAADDRIKVTSPPQAAARIRLVTSLISMAVLEMAARPRAVTNNP